MGSDGEYAAFMNGYLYTVGNQTTRTGYDAEIKRYNSVNFDAYSRASNLMVCYDDGANIIGYIHNNGIYWRSGKGTPVLRTISDEADITPLSFIGKNSSGEYLLSTQDNGFYVLNPTGISANRASTEKISNTSSKYRLSDFF